MCVYVCVQIGVCVHVCMDYDGRGRRGWKGFNWVFNQFYIFKHCQSKIENVSVHLWVVYIWVDFCSLYFYAHVKHFLSIKTPKLVSGAQSLGPTVLLCAEVCQKQAGRGSGLCHLRSTTTFGNVHLDKVHLMTGVCFP